MAGVRGVRAAVGCELGGDWCATAAETRVPVDVSVVDGHSDVAVAGLWRGEQWERIGNAGGYLSAECGRQIHSKWNDLDPHHDAHAGRGIRRLVCSCQMREPDFEGGRYVRLS